MYLANLDPRYGSEPGKTRPVVVIQTDLLNDFHASSIVLPMTSKPDRHPGILRIRVKGSGCGLKKDSDILADQIRAIDNRRLIKRLGSLNHAVRAKVLESLEILILQ